MKEKKEYIEPELYVIEMEKSIFLAASPESPASPGVLWDLEGEKTLEKNGNEDDADEKVGTLSKKHYKEYDLWGM